MENRVNRYSVCHVSFECEGQMNLFLVHYGAGIMLKKRFFKNFFFHEKLVNGHFFFLGQKSLSEIVWTSKTDHTPDKKNKNLIFFEDLK